MSPRRLDDLRGAFSDRLTLRNTLTWSGAVAIFWLLAGADLPQFGTSLLSLAVFGVVDLVEEVYDLRGGVARAGFGAYATVAGAAMLAFADGPLWLPVAFLLVGGWFVLDAVQTARHEGLTETERDGREVYRDYVARRVHETVRERPRTRRELGEALDADGETVDAALGRLLERGVLEQAGSEYRVAPDEESGTLARARERVAGLARRIARPVAVEFEHDERAADTPGDGRTGGVESHAGGAADPADEDSDRDGERDPA